MQYINVLKSRNYRKQKIQRPISFLNKKHKKGIVHKKQNTQEMKHFINYI